MFGFLADSSMLNTPYRDIGNAVQVSTGAIAKAFATLETRGFISVTADGRRLIRSPELLLSEWATGYMSRLRPKLAKFRFSGPPASELLNDWSPELGVSAWSGEVAAEIIARHLHPATATIYMDQASEITAFVKRFRLRADPHGSIEVVKPFWNMERFAGSFPTVPLHVVYADLIATHDARNLAVAELIFDIAVSHVHSSQP